MIYATVMAFVGRYKPWVILGGVLLFLAIVTGAYWKGRGDEASLVKQRTATAQAKQDTRKATADGNADLSRQTDTQTTTQHEEGLKHADDAQPDSGPSRARLALACRRMRDQGSDPSTVPACRGLEGGSQAPPHR